MQDIIRMKQNECREAKMTAAVDSFNDLMKFFEKLVVVNFNESRPDDELEKNIFRLVWRWKFRCSL